MFLLFVHPAHAGRGIGRILLDAVHDALRLPAAGRRSCSPTSRTSGRLPSTRQPVTARTARPVPRISAASACARCVWSSNCSWAHDTRPELS
jgi:GNAT superfamily N-acetyltransferase